MPRVQQAPCRNASANAPYARRGATSDLRGSGDATPPLARDIIFHPGEATWGGHAATGPSLDQLNSTTLGT
jgi:hypothetical protein